MPRKKTSPESISTAPKQFCFVLMPFSDEFHDVYNLGIKEACKNAGAYCERVDEQIFNESILNRVYNQISKADIIIADMTGKNPNVFYEVGYAHALGKLVILLTRNADDIPFDLKHFPHIVYGTKISMLQSELEKRVRYFVENPPDKLSEAKRGLELFLKDINLSSGKTIQEFQRHSYVSLDLRIFNASAETFSGSDVVIGVQTDEYFKFAVNVNDNRLRTTQLPGGGYLHILPISDTLFPGFYTAYTIKIGLFRAERDKLKIGEERTATIKLFTNKGNWEFPIIFRCVAGKA